MSIQMSQTPSSGAGNGARPLALQAALVVHSDIEQHLLLRRAIRQTGLFSVVLSAESIETARDILSDPQAPLLALILIEHALVDQVLPAMTPAQLGRTAYASDAPITDSRHPVLVTPAGPAEIEALLETLS
ncbi:MAG: hypothetical protein AAGM21_09105 [Pseudomonadota bacterium]